jgi:hypothetical protein
MPVCRRFQIEEQTERRGKSERSVKVRHIRFFPVRWSSTTVKTSSS